MTLAGISVSFNGVAAPIVGIAPGVSVGGRTVSQINAIVPWEVTPGTVSVIVTNNGVPSSSINVPIAATDPGIFYIATDSTGVNRPLVYNNSDNTLRWTPSVRQTPVATPAVR